MKALWIWLGALASLGIVCSGANCLFGARLFNRSAHVSADAETYAQDSLQAIMKSWDIKELQSRAAPEYKATAALPQAVEFFKLAKAKLGAMQQKPLFTIKKFVTVSDTQTPSDTNSSTDPGTKSESQEPAPERVLFGGDTKFQKATAGVEITVVKNGDSWQIVYFNVNTPLFRRL